MPNGFAFHDTSVRKGGSTPANHKYNPRRPYPAESGTSLASFVPAVLSPVWSIPIGEIYNRNLSHLRAQVPLCCASPPGPMESDKSGYPVDQNNARLVHRAGKPACHMRKTKDTAYQRRTRSPSHRMRIAPVASIRDLKLLEFSN